MRISPEISSLAQAGEDALKTSATRRSVQESKTTLHLEEPHAHGRCRSSDPGAGLEAALGAMNKAFSSENKELEKASVAANLERAQADQVPAPDLGVFTAF